MYNKIKLNCIQLQNIEVVIQNEATLRNLGSMVKILASKEKVQSIIGFKRRANKSVYAKYTW